MQLWVIPNKIRKFIENKNVKVNIYGVWAYNSAICGYFCIDFIDFLLKGKRFLDYTNVFSPNGCKSLSIVYSKCGHEY